jgi:hypothetical protein
MLAPPESKIEEREYAPPPRASNLVYERVNVTRDGREFVQVSVVAKRGRIIERVDRLIPTDGTDEVISIMTRRTRGRPSRHQTENGNSDHG